MKTRFDGPPSFLCCTLLWLLLSGCTEQTPAPAPPAAPSIVAFTASPDTVEKGGSTTLRFEVKGAEALLLTDDTGKALPLAGETRQGSVSVTPQRSTFFLLRATHGEQSTVAHVQVRVVGEEAAPALFAVPAEVEAGQAAELLWSNPLAHPAELREEGGKPLPLEAGARQGSLSLRPLQSTTYRMSFLSERPPPALEARVIVKPRLSTFSVEPSHVTPGQTVTFRWQAAGGAVLTLRESRFGQLTVLRGLEGTSGPGAFSWVVPERLPSGEPAGSELPLEFSLEVTGPAPEAPAVSATVSAWLGQGPGIDFFEGPDAVTVGREVVLRWKTRNAERLRVLVGGLPIYAPLPSEQAQVKEGRLTLPAPHGPSDYTLEVHAANGRSAQATRHIRPVPLPSIEQFSLPVLAPKAGASVQASWRTKDAHAVVLRLQDGPNLHYTAAPEEVIRGARALLPLRKTTYLLEAYNAAGDAVVASRTVDVRQPAPVNVTPSVAFADTAVSVRYDFGDVVVRELYGVPDVSPERSDAGEWVELEGRPGARVLPLTDPHESVAELSTPGFRFPFIDDLYSRFYVSVNGLVAFRPLPSALPANLPLPQGALPPLLAPYWDDLLLGHAGKLLWSVDGTAYPRRLILQWSDVTPADEPQARLRFQAQLFETGEFRFLYHSLKGSTSLGASATIGAQHAAARFPPEGMVLVGGTRVQPDQSLRFFVAPYNGLEWSQFVSAHARFSAVSQLESGAYAAASLPVWVFRPEHIRVTEVMPAPLPSAVPASEWVELQNDSDSEVDLGGLSLSTTESPAPWLLPWGTRLRPGEHLVLAPSLAQGELDGVPATLAYGDALPMSQSDTLRLQAGPNTVSALSWEGTIPGQSVMAREGFVDGSEAPAHCPRTKTFGQNGSFGSPGHANEGCRPYRKRHATAHFRDISDTGTPLFRFGGLDTKIAPLSLETHPVPLFGRAVSRVHVSTNGYVSVESTSTEDYHFKDTRLPSQETPSETLAIFGDDLTGNSDFSSANVYAEWIPPFVDVQAPVGHWIVQWHHYTPKGQKVRDDLNFQLKLFEDGTVEYQYGLLLQYSPETNRAFGETATIWLQDAEQSALIVSAQRASLQSHLAFRFVPVQP